MSPESSSSIATSGLGRAAGPKPADSELDVFGLTHPGKVRRENQDHFLICQLRRQIHVHSTSLPDPQGLPLESERLAMLAMVADGVGGGPAGEVASRLTVEAVTRYVGESIECYYRADPADDEAFARALIDAALRSHADLRSRGGAESERSRMATTLTLFLGVWPRAYLVQVGDSRYYLLRDDRLIQITRDQTVAEELVTRGVLSRPEAARMPWANVLSSAIGGSDATPVVTRIDQDRSLVHLICSDGLTKHVSDGRIAERLRSMASARQACEALLEDALEGGGTDNVTVIVGRALPG
jgi:protein phosphatase